MRVVVNGWFHASLATGSGQYLDALVNRLPSVAPDHEFVLLVHRPAGESAPSHHGWQVREAGTPFDRISANLAKLWFEQVSFPAACAQLRADVGWVPYWGSPWWLPCPTAVTVHDLIPLLLPAYRGGIMQRVYTALVAQTARRAGAVLTDSAASKADIVRELGISGARVHAVHLAGPSPEAVSDLGSGGGDVRTRYNLPPGPFLLYLGGFDVRKNLRRTVEAYAQLVGRLLSEARPVPQLVIAGRLPAADSAFAPDPRPVVERLRIAEHVHFIGWVGERDKAALYREALAVLFLSEYEGFGLPVLEAMAFGPAAGRPA